jgi:hypothetical protein
MLVTRLRRTRISAILVVMALVASFFASIVFTAGQAGAAITVNAPPVGIARTPDGKGYWLAASDGGVFSFGDAQFYGSMGGKPLNAPIVGMAATSDGRGYWLVASDGGVFSFGDAVFHGSMGGKRLNAPIVGMAANPATGGYDLVAADGGVFAFDSPFHGSMGGKPLNAPVVSIATSPDGDGYWLAASDGGVFSFGDAVFHGSMGGKALNAPVAGIARTPDGNGYWLAAGDGGVFSFGDAAFHGSMAGKPLNGPVVGIARTPDGKGYWLAAGDGGVFALGDATYYGSVQYTPPKGNLGSAATYAKQILANANIDKQTGRLVLQDIEDAAAGRAATAGHPLSATLLSLIAYLGQHHSFTISALESGGTGHVANSYHYSGDAVDFSKLDGVSITGRNAPAITIIKALAGLLPSGSAFAQSDCGTTPPLPRGVTTFPEPKNCTHLHMQVPRGTP